MNAAATLSSTLDRVAVGAPITRVGVSLIPVYLHGARLDVATGPACGVVVAERQDATVPTLEAQNPGDRPALLVEGQVVEGGRQTRVLDVSVLVAAHGSLSIPVSCVEQGRWNGGSDFRSASAFATRRVRRAKNVSQSEHLRAMGSRASDQGAVWHAVRSELQRLAADNPSTALTGAERRLHDDDRLAAATDELRRRGPLPGQCGVVVAHGARIVSAELFASPELLAAHWNALIGGILLDAPSMMPTTRPSLTRALRFVRRMGSSRAVATPGVGLGTELHLRTSTVVSSALVHEGAVVHASAFALAA